MASKSEQLDSPAEGAELILTAEYIARQARALQNEKDTVTRWAEELRQGHSKVLSAVAEHKGTEEEQLANVAGILAGARAIQRENDRNTVGLQVALFVLTHKASDGVAYMTQAEAADALGYTKGRVSQWALEGQTIVTLGESQGWTKGKIEPSKLRTVISRGGGSKVRAALEAETDADGSRMTVERRREAIRKIVAEATAPKAEAPKAEEPKAEEPKAERPRVGDAISHLEDNASILLGAPKLTPVQTKVLRAILGQLVAKFGYEPVPEAEPEPESASDAA